MGQSQMVLSGKADTCDRYRDLYANFEKLGKKMGGILQVDSDYTIHSVALSDDRKVATVDFSSSLDVAGSIMNLRAHSTDRLICRRGKVLLVSSDGNSSVSSGK